jgi:protein SCO1
MGFTLPGSEECLPAASEAMNNSSGKTVLLGAGLLLTILLVVGGYRLSSARPTRASTPPVAAPAPKGQLATLPVLGRLPPFTLTNQTGQAVSSSAMRGRVWIADAIFTRCPGPCPILTRRLVALQHAIPPGDPVSMVSFTVDPDFDQPPVLAHYAQRFGADTNRWWFLTGTKHQLYDAIVKGLKLVATSTEPTNHVANVDMSLHSTMLVVIDGYGRIRGYYKGLPPTAQTTVLKAVHALLN